MTSIDIFSRIELPKEEVFKYLLNSHSIFRYPSPFFRIENLHCSNSKIDQNTYFLQKFVLLDYLQLFYTVKEIIPNEKVVFQFEGLLKGTQSLNLIQDDKSSIIRERIEFSLYNQFNFPILNLLLSLFFYLDTTIKQIRLKNIIYKDFGYKQRYNTKDFSTIRSYITIDTDLSLVKSFFEDLNKFSIWLSPVLNLEPKGKNQFSISFLIPFLPEFTCTLNTEQENKIMIYFSNSLFKGKNIWTFFPYENELILQNSFTLDYVSPYLALIWPIVANSILKFEISNWTRRLKEIAERSGLSKLVEVAS